MARIIVDGDDLVVRLRWWEKAAARHGDVRVPLDAVRRVTVEPDWWRALRGDARRGLWIPGTLCVGTRGHHGGQDFAVVRPGAPVVCVALRSGVPFGLLAVSVPDDVDATARGLRRLAPRIDSSTCAREAIPVPGEI
ncbi:hypothetical protein ACFYZJ_06495 [Streptomyces sp. NPDC001848]|uniref:hypothetical protein n=1 Tax=Streptomyces sp. NPDC001848 TaxID=3364618 RepID=UPI0036BEA204